MMTGLLVTAVIGIVVGFLAGQIMKGGGYGLVGDLIVGVVGCVLGGWLADVLGLTRTLSIGGPLVTQIIVGVLGACLLLFIIHQIKKA